MSHKSHVQCCPRAARQKGRAVSFSGALRVHSVEAKFDHVRGQKCACGGGYLQDGRACVQSVLLDERLCPYVRLAVRCDVCRAPAEFWFDVSPYFGSMFWEQDVPQSSHPFGLDPGREPGTT